MAAAESMGLTFVDEDDLPVAFLRIAHVDSDHEAPSDVDSSDEEENSDDEEQNYSNMRWKSTIQPPEGINFREEVGMRVEMDNDSNCLDYFQLLFTDNVYQLIIKRFEHQKRQLEDNSLGDLHDFTLPELKAWLGLTLAMGLVKKSNLKAYWSTDSVTKTPLFSSTMSRDRYLHILRYLHLERYHTLQSYLFDDPSRNGPKRLKDSRGRPLQRRSRWFYVSFDQNINLLSEV